MIRTSPSSPFPSRAEMENLDHRTDRQKLCSEIFLRTNIDLSDAPSWGDDDLLSLLAGLWERAEPGEVLRVNRKEPAAGMVPPSTFRANSRLADAVVHQGACRPMAPPPTADELEERGAADVRRRVQAEQMQLHAMQQRTAMDSEDDVIDAMTPPTLSYVIPNVIKRGVR